MAERGRRVAVMALTPLVPLGLDEEVAERRVRAVGLGRREHDLAVAGELDLARRRRRCWSRVTRRTSAESSGTTAISVRVSMSPSARWKVTRSVAR